MSFTDMTLAHDVTYCHGYHQGMSGGSQTHAVGSCKRHSELYVGQGFDQTTVAEIAELAGLTERTFFRYFADKREVLFWGAGALQELLVDTVADAPESDAPIVAISAAIQAAGAVFQEQREGVLLRQTVIATNTELQERE